MEVFREGNKTFSTIIPKSVIDNLPMKLEEPEMNIEKTPVNEKIKRRRGRPSKVKTQKSIIYGLDRSTTDGQWVRKDESDVGDRVKVKVERKPEIQGCNADGEIYSENVLCGKKEPINDSFDNGTNNVSRISSYKSDQSTLNIKEEPLDIYHETVFQDLKNAEIKELYVEKFNNNIVKKEESEENYFDQQMNENFVKCESAIIDENEENHSKNNSGKSIEIRHKCTHCKKSYKNKCHLSRHMKYECLMRVEKNEPRYKCSDCHIHFTTKYAMERHFASKHVKEGERTSCDTCRKTFRDQKTLKRHLIRFNCNGVPTNTFTCKNCNKEYRHATSVWRHMNYECEKIARFGCAHCDYMTQQKGNIAKHFRRKHADEEDQANYNCPKCKRTYKNEFTLKRHVNFECGKEPAFSCAHCKFKTKRKFSLDMHITHKHKL